jgi:hypothetical protein
VELGAEREVAHVVDLVGRDDTGLVPAAQQVAELLVAGPMPAFASTTSSRDAAASLSAALGLLADRAGDDPRRRGRCRR